MYRYKLAAAVLRKSSNLQSHGGAVRTQEDARTRELKAAYEKYLNRVGWRNYGRSVGGRGIGTVAGGAGVIGAHVVAGRLLKNVGTSPLVALGSILGGTYLGGRVGSSLVPKIKPLSYKEYVAKHGHTVPSAAGTK